MENIVLFVIISYFASLTTADSTLSPSGANVCRRTYTYMDRMDCETQVPQGDTEFVYKCCNNPPKCFRFRQHERNRIMYEMKLGVEYKCCPGYDQNANACVPFCPANCSGHGECVTPYRCRCDAGWTGMSCSKAVKSDNSKQETQLMYMLGAFCFVCGVVTVVVIFIMWKFRKDYLSSVHRRETLAQRHRLRTLQRKRRNRAVENIYEANPTPNVTDLYEDNEYSTGIDSSAGNFAALHRDVEDVYQEMPPRQSPFSLMEPLHQNYEGSSGLESSAALEGNEKNGAEEDIYQELPAPKFPFPLLESLYENYRDSPEAGHFPIYCNLDVQKNEREDDPTQDSKDEKE